MLFVDAVFTTYVGVRATLVNYVLIVHSLHLRVKVCSLNVLERQVVADMLKQLTLLVLALTILLNLLDVELVALLPRLRLERVLDFQSVFDRVVVQV